METALSPYFPILKLVILLSQASSQLFCRWSEPQADRTRRGAQVYRGLKSCLRNLRRRQNTPYPTRIEVFLIGNGHIPASYVSLPEGMQNTQNSAQRQSFFHSGDSKYRRLVWFFWHCGCMDATTRNACKALSKPTLEYMSGFAIITWNNPKQLKKPCITKGQYLPVNF